MHTQSGFATRVTSDGNLEFASFQFSPHSWDPIQARKGTLILGIDLGSIENPPYCLIYSLNCK